MVRARAVLGRDPADFPSLYFFVQHLRTQGRDEEALKTLKEALAVDATNIFALREATNIAVTLGRHGEGEAFARECLKTEIGKFPWLADALFFGAWRALRLVKSNHRSLPLPEAPSAAAARDSESWRAWAKEYIQWCQARRETSPQ